MAFTPAERQQRYRAKHPERVKAQRLASREQTREYHKAYSVAHRAENRAKANRWHAANRELTRSRDNARNAENPEIHRAKTAAWRKEHPEESRAQRKRRRALIHGATISDFTAAEWREMQAHYDHRCYYCKKRAKSHLTQDHITPLSKGGNHTKHNIVPACQSCNSKKYAGAPPIPVQPLLL